MTNLATPSPEELSERRRTLKQQRRRRNLQHFWRVLAISGLALGAIWLIRNPFWLLLRGRDQVILEGNEMLADDAVHDLLAIEYPQRIFDIEPDHLIEQLQQQAPIADAQVDRQLFPPRVEIILQERIPVAVTIPSRPDPGAVDEPTPISQPGLLDSEGYWLAQSFAAGLNQDFDLPTLKVRGFHARYQLQWPLLYEAMQASPVAIQEIDLRSPNNLIVQTAIGTIHLGVYDARRLPEQLAILPQLRQLTEDPEAPRIDYIDLANPQVPAVKLSEPPESATATP
ncbi:MAG: FtsQ-type POTRA domain-containing protein [Leptolyngbya sp. SIOISBB]|nr:FtsQ-type POTRA domain-containing protein [Leptolyngbya sp. SIOISBB]